ncbi:SRPBCC family protein [Phenylobacterium sp.]|uniref:SRPBCC family protein n=1 Tax=Phenylobacterium sp. TaxID=1871053 RepID=UPI003567FEB4
MQIDVASFIGAVVRRVEDREHEGTPVRVVVASRHYDTGIDDLWDALTRAERIPRWFLPISGDLKLGGKYQLQGNAGGTITECEPPHRLGVTWEFGEQTSWVNVRLSAAGEARTELTLEHLAPIDPHWDTYGPGAVGVGWDLTLIGMALHLAAGGAAVDKDAFAAWSPSDAGKAFIRGSAAGWGAADIEGGEDPAKARAAADLTAKFYTGG